MKQITNNIRWAVGTLLSFLAAGGLLVACNSHPVELVSAAGEISEIVDYSPGAAAEIDILWVIDNSGSMCEEQAALRENFQAFVQDISERNVDFHIGVTTTQMQGAVPLETVARPGELQSMPQPVVTFRDCIGNEGDPDDQYDGYATIRNNIEVAIDTCSKNPAKWDNQLGLKDVTDDEIACHLNETCGKYYELYPTTEDGRRPTSAMSAEESPYREIPKVLKAVDYRDGENGPLNVAKLEKDFACMSFVGTSGSSIEKGLAAAIDVVSPEKTGGTAQEPTNPEAPNNGFLRKDSNLALIFVTDENDCTHDGSLDEQSTCGGDICAFANNPALSETPLIGPEQLADDFVDNAWLSKGGSADDVEGKTALRDKMVIGSIHGRWKRYGQDYPDPDTEGQPFTIEACDDSQEPPEELEEQESCNGAFGVAYSGDRYDRFLRSFDNDSIFPSPAEDNLGSPLDPLICASTDQFATTMSELGTKIAGSAAACYSEAPYECETADDCFGFMFGEGTAECVQFAETDKKYCTSGLQVRMYPDPESSVGKTFADLDGNDYCIQESLDSVVTPGGCVVSPEKYEIVTCPGKDLEMSLTWNEDTANRDLNGYSVELIYTLRSPDEQEEPANNAEE